MADETDTAYDPVLFIPKYLYLLTVVINLLLGHCYCSHTALLLTPVLLPLYLLFPNYSYLTMTDIPAVPAWTDRPWLRWPLFSLQLILSMTKLLTYCWLLCILFPIFCLLLQYLTWYYSRYWTLLVISWPFSIQSHWHCYLTYYGEWRAIFVLWTYSILYSMRHAMTNIITIRQWLINGRRVRTLSEKQTMKEAERLLLHCDDSDGTGDDDQRRYSS